jgi:hypothetical protein
MQLVENMIQVAMFNQQIMVSKKIVHLRTISRTSMAIAATVK